MKAFSRFLWFGSAIFIFACNLPTRHAPTEPPNPPLASPTSAPISPKETSISPGASSTTPPNSIEQLPGNVLERSIQDRPDDAPGSYQIHVMYVVPSDGRDRQLDTSGTLSRSLAAIENWFAGQTNGSHLRLDTYNGALDITFQRLDQNSQQAANYLNSNAYVRDAIEAELSGKGLIQPNKLYAVYYDGLSTYACGGGAWPPDLIGHVATLYLKGAYGSVVCDNDQFTSDINSMAINEYKMIHEILHTMGFVAACAPHHVRAGHTSDDPNDLLYAGDQAWYPNMLDFNHDDYYQTGNPNCPDLANSVFLEPLPASPQKPPSWP